MDQPTQDTSTTVPPPSVDPRRRREIVRRLKRLFLILLLAWLASSAIVTWKLTRRMAPIEEPPPFIANVDVVADRIRTADGQTLGAWFVAGSPDHPTVLLLHGYTSARREWTPVFTELAQQHYGVLAVTLRGHGDSTGGTLDIGYSSQHDVVAAVAYLESHCPHRPVVVCGTSLGAASAIFASKELGTRVAAYVLDSPYKNLQTAVWNRLENQLPWPLAYVAYPGMRLWAPAFMKTPVTQISPLRHVADIPPSVPVTFLSGGADRNARPEEADALLDRVRSHARLYRFPDLGHSELLHQHPDRFLDVLLDAVRSAIAPPTTQSATSRPSPAPAATPKND